MDCLFFCDLPGPITRLCQRCRLYEPVSGERYCFVCRDSVLAELERSGYLQELPPETPKRHKLARENIVETKYGID